MKKIIPALLLSFSVAANAAPFVIKDVQIEGLDSAQKEQLLSKMQTLKGARINDNEIGILIKNLYATGQYQNVKASNNNNILVLHLDPLPIISKVTFEGSKLLPADALQTNFNNVGIKAGELLDKSKIDAMVNEITSYYHNMGRSNALVEYTVIPQKTGLVELKINIYEEVLTEVKQIIFVGNKAFSDKELLSRISSETSGSFWNVFANDSYTADKIANDIDELRSTYGRIGYAKVQIADPIIEFSPNKKNAYITFNINEGKQYNISSVNIIGDMAEYKDQVTAFAKNYKAGERFDSAKVNMTIENIKNELGNVGFAKAKVDIALDFDEEQNQVVLNYIVDAGRRYNIREISFSGNTVTKDEVLRRELTQHENSAVSLSAISLGKLRLDRTGFFQSVNYKLLDIPNKNEELDLLYQVEERKTGSFNVGVGYGTDDGINYTLGTQQTNLLGSGNALSFNATKNSSSTNLSIDYTRPYITVDGISLSGGVFFNNYKSDKHKSQSSYKNKSYGLYTALGFNLNENNSVSVGLSYIHNKISGISPEFQRDLYLDTIKKTAEDAFKTHDFELTAAWTYNGLNKGFMPTEGIYGGLAARITIPPSDNKYYRLSGDVAGYYPLDNLHNFVLMAKADAGYTSGFGSKRVPFYKLYSAGGINSIRGFESGSIGPRAIYRNETTPPGTYDQPSSDVVGGNVYATSTIGLIVPTPFIDHKAQANLRSTIFADIGTVWSTKWKKDKESSALAAGIKDYDLINNSNSPSKFRASAGVSLEWNSPVGPLVFTYAMPIKKYTDDNIQRFQFSIGGMF